MTNKMKKPAPKPMKPKKGTKCEVKNSCGSQGCWIKNRVLPIC